MLLETYVKVTLFLAGVPIALHRRMAAKRQEDTGLATLEWVALAVLAVGLAVLGAAGIKEAIDRKVKEIP